MKIRTLTLQDLPGALRLSTQAGWNQLPADWRRLIDAAPHGAFGGWIDDALVATATVVSYGTDAAWIGMVLVDEDRRGAGLGRRILEHAIGAARERCGAAVGLDATHLGRPLYLKLGFHDVSAIDRWGGVLDARGPAAAPYAGEDLSALDRKACGADRSALLRGLAADPAVRGWTIPGGYAFLRPGRDAWHLGPWVAPGAEGAASLLAAASRALGSDALVLDAPRRPDTAALLQSSGLTIRRELTRMTLERPQPLLSGPQVWAAATFEWG